MCEVDAIKEESRHNATQAEDALECERRKDETRGLWHKAGRWYLKASKLAHPPAQLRLVYMYLRGHRMEGISHEGEAKNWCAEAASLGSRQHLSA